MAIKQICKSNTQERHLRQHESPLFHKDTWKHHPKKGTYIGGRGDPPLVRMKKDWPLLKKCTYTGMSKPSHTDETRPLPDKGTYTALSPPSSEMMKQDHWRKALTPAWVPHVAMMKQDHQEWHLHHHESPFLQGWKMRTHVAALQKAFYFPII